MIDVKGLKTQFDNSTKDLVEKLISVPEDKFFVRKEENKWSVGEIGEHLYKVDTPVVLILQGEKSEQPLEKPERKKLIIERSFGDTNKKFTAHGPIVPQNDFDSKEELINAIKQTRKQISDMIEQIDLAYVCLSFKHPLLGEMTGAEWLHFIILHTERHLTQFRY